MPVRCIRVRLKPRSLNKVKNWFFELNKRRNEVLESMKNENVIVESAFLDKQNGHYYLIYYIKSTDIKKALEIFEKSLLPIDVFYKKNWNQFCDNLTVLDTLLDLDLIE